MAELESGKGVVAGQYDTAGQSWHKIRGSGHELLEKPALYALLPQVESKRVLCVGSGYGEECARISALGASRVIGIDLSAMRLVNVTTKKSRPIQRIEVFT